MDPVTHETEPRAVEFLTDKSKLAVNMSLHIYEFKATHEVLHQVFREKCAL